jgi:acyl-CoA synthetase (AMP-forming)/AMP-acid ligase II
MGKRNFEEMSAGERPDQTPTTLLGLLERAASKWPNHGIKVCRSIDGDDFESLSYSQLLSQAKVCSYHRSTNKS